MSIQVEELRDMRKSMETAVRDLIVAFERTTGARVQNVYIERIQTIGSSANDVRKVNIEVLL